MRKFTILTALLLAALLVLSACNDPVPSVTPSESSNAKSEEKEVDWGTVHTYPYGEADKVHFENMDLFLAWFEVSNGLSKSQAYRRLWISQKSEQTQLFALLANVEKGLYPLGVPQIDGVSIVDTEHRGPIRFTSDGSTFIEVYECEAEGRSFTVQRWQLPEGELSNQEGILADYASKMTKTNSETAEIGEIEDVAILGEKVPGIRVQYKDDDFAFMLLLIEGSLVKIKTYDGFLPDELLSRFDFRYVYTQNILLGSTDEETGKNGFFDISTRGLDELVLAEKELSDEEMEAFLAGNEGRRSYAFGGLKTREDLDAFLGKLEERGLYVPNDYDEYGLRYYGDSDWISVWYRMGGTNVQFDYLATVEQFEEAYKVITETLDYAERKGAAGWKDYGHGVWFYSETEDAFCFLLSQEGTECGMMITVSGEDTVHLKEEKSPLRWFRETFSGKFTSVTDRAQFE